VFATRGFVRALERLTVVDLTRYLPGPYCTRLLADLGAHVVKVEPPQGDPMRGVAWYEQLNHGKEIVTLDLREAGGRDALHALLGRAAVCVEGFKPATARAIGVDGASLAARYPGLVHCSISGYGQSGPLVDRSAHDINYQADAGLLGAASPPQVPGLLVADITAAYHATIAILAALLNSNERTTSPAVDRPSAGEGTTLDISLFAAAKSWVPFVPPPKLRGDFACYNVYETADGQWVALGALEAKFWQRFCQRVDRAEWIPLQFTPGGAQQELIEAVRTLLRRHDLAYWSAALGPVDCCFSPVPALPR
jgi:alpha-methylacyl-CoA racemase